MQVVARPRWLALVLLLVVAASACDVPAEGATRRADRDRRGSEAVEGDAGHERRLGLFRPVTLPETGRDPYADLGTWIDVYDDEAWARPEATVQAMRAAGVRTIYLQTSNFNRGRPFVHRGGVVRFLDAAARDGLDVVAWYLPGFRDVRTDLKRTIAAIRLTTPSGNRFDSFALDIESPEVQRPSARTARLLRLSTRIRRIVGDEYRLGAIVPSPRRVRTDRSYWTPFPYRQLAGLYDVFLPMTYFTWRVSGREGAAWYTAKNILILRQETAGMNVPIHVIGGIASDASAQETRGFVDTILNRDVIGASYYTFPLIRQDQWNMLRAIR